MGKPVYGVHPDRTHDQTENNVTNDNLTTFYPCMQKAVTTLSVFLFADDESEFFPSKYTHMPWNLFTYSSAADDFPPFRYL